ncbi:MAG: helix-turn-helix domain-containing protein, partial [Candidatus Omnitrophica bacterium]|nr:helix-turn-helix domain-containing protein [Candidatus Omnitrophota bacterium]
MAGLSLGDLSDRLRGVVSRQALYKYERGQMMPSKKVAALLEKALNLSRFEPFIDEVSFDVGLPRKRSTGRAFLISPVSEAKSERSAVESAIRQIRFREREKLPAKTASSLKLKVADYINRCHEIEGALGMRVPFENPIASRSFRSPADVERAASDVRRAWNLGAGPLTNLLGVLEEKGIRVFEVRDIEGFEGLSGRYEGEPFITVNRDFPADRVRFTA